MTMNAENYCCTNCGQPIWHKFYRTKCSFCSKQCKQEYHYLRIQMSRSQMALLEYLITHKGTATVTANCTTDSLLFKVMPLIEIVQDCGKEVVARITDTGFAWFDYHRKWYEGAIYKRSRVET